MYYNCKENLKGFLGLGCWQCWWCTLSFTVCKEGEDTVDVHLFLKFGFLVCVLQVLSLMSLPMCCTRVINWWHCWRARFPKGVCFWSVCCRLLTLLLVLLLGYIGAHTVSYKTPLLLLLCVSPIVFSLVLAPLLSWRPGLPLVPSRRSIVPLSSLEVSQHAQRNALCKKNGLSENVLSVLREVSHLPVRSVDGKPS